MLPVYSVGRRTGIATEEAVAILLDQKIDRRELHEQFQHPFPGIHCSLWI